MSDDPSLVVRGPEDVVSFLNACGVPADEPAQILLGLALADSDPLTHAVCGAAVRSGPEAVRPVDAVQLVDLAAELLVGAVVLATVECGGARAPSRHEVARFVALRRDCADEGVVLLDWIVLAGRHWWSMRERVIHEAA
ncbi:MAG: hypothetical protein WDA60_10265 [Acidimicrobiia bacterium]|jgi:hypothetical protein